jgi:hypothetical protein
MVMSCVCGFFLFALRNNNKLFGTIARERLLFSSNLVVGYFKREQKKIRKCTDTDVAFTREYSRVLICMGNVKCTRRIRNIQGKGNYRVERVFRVF